MKIITEVYGAISYHYDTVSNTNNDSQDAPIEVIEDFKNETNDSTGNSGFEGWTNLDYSRNPLTVSDGDPTYPGYNFVADDGQTIARITKNYTGTSYDVYDIVTSGGRGVEQFVTTVTITQNDIQILYITQEESGTDVVVTIFAESSNGGLEYSLSGQSWQSDNQFTISTAGQYVAWVRDSEGYFDTEAFEIAFDTEYVTRWQGQFDDNPAAGDSATRYTASIKELGYSGTITTITRFTGTPCEITRGKKGSNLYDPIQGSECVLNFLSESDFQFSDLFTSEDKKYLLELTTSSGTVWTGFLNPEFFQEPYASTPYPVSASFVDGLSLLKNRKFRTTVGDVINASRPVISVIAFCLQQTGLKLDIYVTCKVFESQMGNQSTDALGQIYVNTDVFYDRDGEPLNCYEVIEHCLSIFGGRIWHEDGIWKITNVDQMSDGIYRREIYNYSGVYQGYDTYDPDLTISKQHNSGNVQWENQTMLSNLPALKEVNVTCQVKSVDSVIKNSDFSELDTIGNPKYWTDDSGILERVTVSDGRSQKEIARLTGDYTSTGGQYVRSEPVFLDFDDDQAANPQSKLNLRVRFRIGGSDNSEMRLKVRINESYWLVYNNDLPTWTNSDNYIGIKNNGGWNEVEIGTPVIPVSPAIVEVFWYQGADLSGGSARISYTDVEYIELGYVEQGVVIPEEKTHTFVNPGKFIQTLEREVLFADFDEFLNPQPIIKNTLLIDDGTELVHSKNWVNNYGNSDESWEASVSSSKDIQYTGDLTGNLFIGDEITISGIGDNSGVFTITSISYSSLPNLTNIEVSPQTLNSGSGASSISQIQNRTAFQGVLLDGNYTAELTGVAQATISGGTAYDGTWNITDLGYSSPFTSVYLDFGATNGDIIDNQGTLSWGVNTDVVISVSGGKKTLLAQISQRIGKQYSSPKQILTGQLWGDLEFSNVLIEPNQNTKKFTINQQVWDIKNRAHRVELIELAPADASGYILLEDGYKLLLENGDKLLRENG